ncbi:MAG: copper chaperone PCu(A)C [Thiotrichaceae bacterium]
MKTTIGGVFALLLAMTVAIGLVACGEKTASDSTSIAVTNTTMTASEVVHAKNAYIRAMPPGQQVTALFVTLDNTSNQDHYLLKVESYISDAVELHEHKHENGIMKMGQVKRIAIPKNGSVALAPGGYHVMLIGLKEDLKLGDKVIMKMIFEDGSTQDVLPEVKAINTEQ